MLVHSRSLIYYLSLDIFVVMTFSHWIELNIIFAKFELIWIWKLAYILRYGLHMKKSRIFQKRDIKKFRENLEPKCKDIAWKCGHFWFNRQRLVTQSHFIGLNIFIKFIFVLRRFNRCGWKLFSISDKSNLSKLMSRSYCMKVNLLAN